ncbi:cation diffusion facilitator family transporter [Marinicella sp. S1101]|uniref:cation diffusion facilitator family transporter n=1 Tax=Marinicella marina TaxID=2996016 RepID=UPI002260BE5B|nr:cation diffusion facilitator family transporter [Marinicella marina]MCX7553607.1 cation diffusion facilitator family transporter [Marinicella marina]MDJ1140231.1 cation diffusion facilitator family transporter [Marinicella marina]
MSQQSNNHQHHHGHEHDHHHDHSVAVNPDNKTYVMWAMVLTFGFMFAEVIGGIISGSLALLADAGHMLSDGVALLLSWLAFKFSERETSESHTFGWHRFQILAAFVNGLSLMLIAVWIVFEAITRFLSPVTVMATPMLVIATLGLVVNLVVFKILSSGDQENLNLKSAMIHVIGDLLGSVAAILAALLIMFFGWHISDPLLSILVAVLIVRSGWIVVKKSAHILIEGTPSHVDETAIKQQLINHIESVTDVHHIHAWSLTNEINLITLHIQVDEVLYEEDVLRQAKDYLEEHFNMQHVTIQIEHLTCPDQACLD